MLNSGFWEIKRKVIKHYDKISRIYNALYGYEQKLKIDEILKILHINPLDIVLDAGCGTGLLFSYISNSVRFIVGVDISSKTLKVAKNLVKKDRLNNVFLIRADVDFLPFRDEVFDKIFAITLLQNMPDPILTLHEIARVAKNTSEIIITGLKKFFSKEDFLGILREFGIATSLIDTDEKIKCHIAICSKSNKHKGNRGKSINNRTEK